MKVITIANRRPKEPYYTYDQFFESLRRFDCEPIVISEGFGGLGSKPRLFKKQLLTMAQDERVILCDAFDIVFAAHPEAVNERALTYYGHQICWNAERNCFPDASMADKHPPASSSFQYLNSGFAIGSVEDFLTLFENMNADAIPDDYKASGRDVNPNDQEYFMREFVEGELTMHLDDRCELCQTLCGVGIDELDFSEDHIRNKETGSYPMAFHFNGGAKTGGTREAILAKLKL